MKIIPDTMKISSLGYHQNSFMKLLQLVPIFLKNVFVFFGMNYIRRNVTYSCFIIPSFNRYSFSFELPCAARFLIISCFEEITECVIEIMLVT